MFIVMLEFYSPTPTPDIRQLAKAFRNWGHRVWVGTPDFGGDFCIEEDDVTIARVAGPCRNSLNTQGTLTVAPIRRRIANVRFMLRVRRLLNKVHPDVVQVNPFGFAFIFPIWRRSQSVYVLDIRQAGEGQDANFMGRLKNWRIRLRHRINARYFYHHTCFLSSPAAKRILGPKWQTWATVHPLSQDSSFLTYQWQSTRSFSKSLRIRFVYLGSVARVRKLEVLLEAIRTVSVCNRNFSVDFIGPDKSNGFYQEFVDDWNLGDIVRFLPSVPYSLVAETIAKYDVALAYVPPLPDWRYQPTLKVLEYRALGLPILASDSQANRLVVVHQENGLLVDHSVSGIAHGIRQLSEDRALVERLTLRARNMRCGRTWEESAQEYLNTVYAPCVSTLRADAQTI